MYLYIIFTFLYLSALFFLFEKHKSNILSHFIYFVIFILSFIRWEIGTDWISYFYYYDSINPLEYADLFSNYIEFEYGFEIMSRFVKMFSDSYTLFLFVQSLIIFLLFFQSIKIYSVNIPFTYLCLFSINFCNMFFVRQNIAVAITIYSIIYIYERKFLKFIICIFIASLFHTSSLLFVLSYFVWNIKLTKRNVFYYLIAILFLCYFFILGIDKFANSSIFTRLASKIIFYIEVDKTNSFGSAYSPYVGFVRGNLYRIFQLFLIYSFLKNEYFSNNILRGFVNIYILGVFVYIICFLISPGLIRFSLYFEIIQIFILPYLIFKFRNLYSRIILLLLFGFYLGFRLNGVIYNYTNLYIPYKSIYSTNI